MHQPPSSIAIKAMHVHIAVESHYVFIVVWQQQWWAGE
jgi:hypothetical protein